MKKRSESLKTSDVSMQKKIRKLTDKNEKLRLHLSDTCKAEMMLPIDFVIWYSGAKKSQIHHAYKLFLNEFGK